MKVTFTCEKCGWSDNNWLLNDDSPIPKEVIAPPCPNCSKLSYGPFTEEMMTEAVKAVQATGPTYDDECKDVANFILRLLNKIDCAERLGFPFVSGGERDWLLDLAKKP